MKKIFSYYVCLIVLLTAFSIPRVHAGVATGNSTEWTQIANFVKLTLTSAKEAITAANTAITAAKETIGNPFLAAMITGMQQQAARDINNWARGNFQGNSSVITNPEAYVKNVGLETIRGGLITVTSSGTFEDKVLGAVINSVRNQNADLTKQLSDIARSDLPALIKSNTCTDQALNDLVSSEGLIIGTAEFQVRKNQIYNSLCVGDPNTDPNLASRLKIFGNTNPTAAQATGLDSILLVSSGDNDFVRSMRATDAANQAAAAKKDVAKADLAAGGGTAGKRECTKYASSGSSSAFTPGAAPCLEYKVTTPSGQVSVSLSTSLTAGIDRLTNLGPDGFAALLGGYFMKAIENQTANFIFDNNDVGGTGAANNASYFAVAPTSGVRVSVTNTPITNITNRVYVQDLINDPQTKNSLIAPIIKQLTAYGASLDDLEQTDTDYGAQIAEQQARLSAAKSCFDSITTRYAPYTNDPNVIASQDKIKSLQDKIDTARATITSDAAAISTARSLITTTRNAVTNSNSSNQINDLFSAYQNAIDSQDLPSITASSDRMSLFEKLRTALQGPTGSTKDQITLLQEQCTTLEQQIPAGTPDVPPVDGGGGAGDGGSGGY